MQIETLQFSQVLSAAVTPLVLISGVGLILLSLVNRYNHAIDRIRQLYSSSGGDLVLAEKRSRQVEQLYRRCRLLKQSIGFIVFSIVCSSIIVLFSLLQSIVPVKLDPLRIVFLFLAVAALVVSTALLFLDISLSMKALDIELGKRD